MMFNATNGFIDIKIDPGNNQEWIAVADDGDKDSSTCPGGVYRSMDGGKTWSTPETVLHNVMAVDISGDYIYSLTGRSAEVYVSPDRGNTWTGPYQPNGNRCRNLLVDPIDSLRAYCLIYVSQEKNSELWLTTNAGVSWEKQSSLGIIASFIELVPTLPDEIIIGGFGFEVSKDKGNTWETRQNGLGAREFAIKFDPWGGSELYAYDMFCMDYSKLYKSQDNGLNFEDISPPSQFDACDLAFGFGNQIYRWQYSWFFNSPDSGKTWVENQLQNESDFTNGFGASPYSDGTLLYTLMFTNGIFKSTDGGDSWTLVDETSDTQRDFYFASEKSKRVYSSAGNVMVSDDLGSSWRTCGDPRAYADRNSNNFVIDPENDDIIYLATADKGVLTSTDGCGSWSTINNGIGSLTVNTVAVHPNDSAKIVCWNSKRGIPLT